MRDELAAPRQSRANRGGGRLNRPELSTPRPEIGGSVQSTTTKYKGLSPSEQQNVLFGFRPDTLASNGYPARPSEIGTPSGGTAINYFTDVGVSKGFFSTGADSADVTYDDPPGGLLFSQSSEDEADLVEGYNINENLDYSGIPHHTSCTVGFRFQQGGAGLSSSGDRQTLLSTGHADGVGSYLWFGLYYDGTDINLRAELYNSGTELYDISTPVTLASSGFDEAILEHDVSNGTASISFNRGSQTASVSSVSFPSGPVTAEDRAIVGGTAFTGSNSNTRYWFDGHIEGSMTYLDTSKESAVLDWISGNEFSTSSSTATYLEGSLSTYNEWQNLPSSPTDDDRVFYDPADGGKFLLEWDSGLSKWVCVSTGDEFEELPITKNGAVNSDLFNISTSGSPVVSVSSGVITIDHDTADTSQSWDAFLNMGLRRAELEMAVDSNGSSASSGFPYAGWEMQQPAGNDNQLLGRLVFSGPDLTWDQFDSGGFVSNIARQAGVSSTAIHFLRGGIGYENFLSKTYWYVQTETSGGSVKSNDQVIDVSYFDTEVSMKSRSGGSTSATPSFDIHSFKLRV